MKSETDVIVNPPSPHELEGLFHHFERPGLTGSLPVAKQEKKVVGRGEFRGVPKPPRDGIETPGKILEGLLKGGTVRFRPLAGFRRQPVTQ